MLAEQCTRYEEMVSFLEDLLNTKEGDLNSDERNLLSIAYKNSISSRRTALRTIMAYESKEAKKGTSNFLPYIKEYRKQVEKELSEKCQGIINSIDNKLVGRAQDDEAKVFYIKMKGDYNRYIAEYSEDDAKTKVAEEALKAYKEASEIAKSLDALNPIALGLALNFSVFYYEVKGDHETACKIAEEAIEKSKEPLDKVDKEDDEYRDTVSIVNLLNENLEMWKNEGNED